MIHEQDSAFPMQRNETDNSLEWGVTKLEYFSIMVMQGLLSAMTENNGFTPKIAAEESVRYAKALIEELNKQ